MGSLRFRSRLFLEVITLLAAYTTRTTCWGFVGVRNGKKATSVTYFHKPLAAVTTPSSTSFTGQLPRVAVVLSAGASSGDEEQPSSSPSRKRVGKKEGVYARPSAAIERGSGFFVPGLEGAKVRLLGGVVLLALVPVVSSGNPITNNTGDIFSQALAAVFAALLIFQAAVEFQKEEKSNRGDLATRGNAPRSRTVWQKQWSVASTDMDWRDRVEWAASSYLALTPATNMMLFGPGKIVFSLGSSSRSSSSTAGEVAMDTAIAESEACLKALETLSKSAGGRVALPMTHPVVKFILSSEDNANTEAEEETTRCVILQRVSDESQLCWVISSDQLLVSFTKQDLKWLGRLAQYIEP
jgi:hypothetical protein